MRIHEISYLIFIEKLGKMLQNLLSAAVVIGALRVKIHMSPFRPELEKTCLRGFANNKGADQPAHPRSLISDFVIRFLENIIYENLLQVKF